MPEALDLPLKAKSSNAMVIPKRVTLQSAVGRKVRNQAL
jgi:hypothetical protein